MLVQLGQGNALLVQLVQTRRYQSNLLVLLSFVISEER
jgi:hypothetical protein